MSDEAYHKTKRSDDDDSQRRSNLAGEIEWLWFRLFAADIAEGAHAATSQQPIAGIFIIR